MTPKEIELKPLPEIGIAFLVTDIELNDALREEVKFSKEKVVAEDFFIRGYMFGNDAYRNRMNEYAAPAYALVEKLQAELLQVRAKLEALKPLMDMVIAEHDKFQHGGEKCDACDLVAGLKLRAEAEGKKHDN